MFHCDRDDIFEVYRALGVLGIKPSELKHAIMMDYSVKMENDSTHKLRRTPSVTAEYSRRDFVKVCALAAAGVGLA